MHMLAMPMLTWCVCMAQSQFGVGLREAAHNLRICPTTLKRACRRHGIYRWPRRQSWGGGPGDDGSADSMSLDGDVPPPAGATTGSAPPLSGPGTACCMKGLLLVNARMCPPLCLGSRLEWG